MRIFLSGAIEGVDNLATTWRNEAAAQLGFDHEIISPLVAFDKQVFRTPNEIVHRNMMLQQSCDMLLVEYMIPNRNYVGTDFEMAMARVWNQPAIVFANEMYRERIYLQYMATVILPSLEDAIDYVLAFYPVS